MRFLQKIKDLFISNKETEDKKCINCKFNTDFYCNVGSYYAKKGINKVCYSGELWEKIETHE